MDRRDFFSVVVSTTILISGCTSRGSNRQPGDADSRTKTTDCLEPSKKQGFMINSANRNDTSINISIVDKSKNKKVFEKTYSIKPGEKVNIGEGIFTNDSKYIIRVEDSDKFVREIIEGADQKRRLRRRVVVNIRENGGLDIVTLHADGYIPPACD